MKAGEQVLIRASYAPLEGSEVIPGNMIRVVTEEKGEVVWVLPSEIIHPDSHDGSRSADSMYDAARQFLLRYQRADEQVRQMEEELTRLRTEIDSTRIQLSDMPHGTELSDATANYAVQLADAEVDLQRMKARAESTRGEVLTAISQVQDATAAAILYERYIQLRTISEIVRRLNYSRRQVYRLMDDGLRDVEHNLRNH
jgi:DNA-directed RNA polymerase specialized sigma subunit